MERQGSIKKLLNPATLAHSDALLRMFKAIAARENLLHYSFTPDSLTGLWWRELYTIINNQWFALARVP